MDKVRKGKILPGTLYAHAVESVSLSSERWFHAIENIAFLETSSQIERLLQQAYYAKNKELVPMENSVRTLVKGWASFEKDLRSAAKDRPDFLTQVPKRNLETAIDRLPVPYPGFPQIISKFQSAMKSTTPDDDLRKLQIHLLNIRNGKIRYSVESRAELVRYQIASIALRRLFADDPEEDIINKLRPMGKKLKQLNGSFDMGHFGPRIQKIFDGIR